MKIAITADVHLADKNVHPERYNALGNILDKISEGKIDTLIIAGDLFDETYNNYSEFDKLASRYNHINFHIIPGNHDALIDNTMFTSKNVEIYSEPTLKGLDESKYKFLFLPYNKDMVMGESIAAHKDELEPNNWVLIGHGDWERGMKISNPLEPGVYMPLSQKDINLYKPAFVFLGHIHKYLDDESICYPGSPCGLDVTETGKRRFLIVDTKDLSMESYPVDSDVIYFDETFLMLPLDDEETYIRKMIQNRIKEWNIEDSDKSKTRVRVKVRGYSTDIRKLDDFIKDEFKDFSFYDKEGANIDDVCISHNLDLEEISRKVINYIDDLNWPTGTYQPSRDAILFHALKTVYGDA